MNKEQAIDSFIKIIYNSTEKLVLTDFDKKYLNDYYRKNYDLASTYDKFKEDKRIERILNTLKSGEKEVFKQFIYQKALQAGVITECIYTQTIAKALNLNEFIDLDSKTTLSKDLNNVKPFLKEGKNTLYAARYIFYSKENKDVFVIQYGSPTDGDADVIYFGNKIHLEYKEQVSRAGEYDLVVLDNGTLGPSNKMKKEFPEMIDFLNIFNKTTSLYDYLGKNFKILKTENNNPMNVVKNYFVNNKIDLLISSVNDELIIIKPSDLSSNELEIANTNGSEIRTTGRNHKRISALNFFKKCIKEDAVLKENSCVLKKIEKKGYGFVKERGKETYRRYKINYMFFLYVEDFVENEETIEFKYSKVEQTIPTISFHINILVTKEQLKKFYKI